MDIPKTGPVVRGVPVDPWIEKDFDLRDRVYFRRFSPLSLFECFSPKLDGLFWFAPKNLQMSDVIDENGWLEREKVPRRYRYDTSMECERIGLEQLEKQRRL